MALLALSTHARNLVRHLLAIVLMLGTLAGTVWTFSAGALTLSGAGERLVSVGGVAAALECAVIYTGWYIGQLDQRITSARKREDADTLRAQQRSLYHWFYAVAAISAGANLVFRSQQLHNLPLAVFVSLSPIVLVILFCVKLRPLPEDYEEMGRQATKRGLVRVVREAEHTMMRSFRRMGRGHVLTEADTRQFLLAVSLVSVYAGTTERNALDYVVSQQALPAPDTSPAATSDYYTTRDIMTVYGVSQRTAQLWAATCPGRRKAPNHHAWEAPRAAIEAAHGLPALALVGAGMGNGGAASPVAAHKRNSAPAQNAASGAQSGAGEAQSGAGEAQRMEGGAPME